MITFSTITYFRRTLDASISLFINSIASDITCVTSCTTPRDSTFSTLSTTRNTNLIWFIKIKPICWSAFVTIIFLRTISTFPHFTISTMRNCLGMYIRISTTKALSSNPVVTISIWTLLGASIELCFSRNIWVIKRRSIIIIVTIIGKIITNQTTTTVSISNNWVAIFTIWCAPRFIYTSLVGFTSIIVYRIIVNTLFTNIVGSTTLYTEWIRTILRFTSSTIFWRPHISSTSNTF